MTKRECQWPGRHGSLTTVSVRLGMVRVVTGDEAQRGPDPIGAARDAAEAAGERFDQARADAGERLGAARDAARAKAEAAANAIPKPRLRGVSHQWAFFCSLVAGA